MTITLPPWTVYAAFFVAGHLSRDTDPILPAWVLILAFAATALQRGKSSQ